MRLAGIDGRTDVVEGCWNAGEGCALYEPLQQLSLRRGDYVMALIEGTSRAAHATTLSMHGNIEPTHNLETYVQCISLQNTHSIRWRTPWVRHEHETGVRFTTSLVILLQHIKHFKHETHVEVLVRLVQSPAPPNINLQISHLKQRCIPLVSHFRV